MRVAEKGGKPVGRGWVLVVQSEARYMGTPLESAVGGIPLGDAIMKREGGREYRERGAITEEGGGGSRSKRPSTQQANQIVPCMALRCGATSQG